MKLSKNRRDTEKNLNKYASQNPCRFVLISFWSLETEREQHSTTDYAVRRKARLQYHNHRKQHHKTKGTKAKLQIISLSC
jgi:hypothetical protein